MSRKTTWDFSRDIYFYYGDTEYTAVVRFVGYDDPGVCGNTPETSHAPEGESEFEVLEVKGCDKYTHDYSEILEAAESAAMEEINNGLDLPDDNEGDYYDPGER
jgi:hypothetical protein